MMIKKRKIKNNKKNNYDQMCFFEIKKIFLGILFKFLFYYNCEKY